MTFPTQEHIDAAQAAEDEWFAKTGRRAWASVALGQAADESAYWTKLSGKNNGFGITETRKERIAAGKATLRKTREWDAKLGKLVWVERYFADFDSIKEAYSEHARILTTVSCYRDAWSETTADGFLAKIAPHYASIPTYAGIIRGYMKQMNTYQYDRPALGAATEKPKANPAVVGGAAGVGAVVVSTVAQHLPALNWEPFAALAVVVAVVGLIYLVRRGKNAAAYAQAAATPTVEPRAQPAAPAPAPAPVPAPAA